MLYRWLLTGLRGALRVTESLMAQRRWDEIVPTKVSSVAMKVFEKAFQNERRDTGPGYEKRPSRDPARLVLRTRVLEAVGAAL